MYYSATTITNLQNRIGWAPPVPPVDFAVTASNLQSDSGRLFSDYCKLSTVEVVSKLQPKSIKNGATPVTDPNPQLASLKRSAVLRALGKVFDNNPRANQYKAAFDQAVDISANEYDNIIAARPYLLDEVIGYAMAVEVIEMAIASNRSNFEQRLMQEAMADMRLDLDGYTDTTGQFVSPGVRGQLRKAVENLTNILWPERARPIIRNASHKW